MTDESVVIHDADADTYRDASGPLTISGGGGPPTGAAGGVLSGTYPDPGFAVDMATQAELDAHTGDTVDAHDASAISFSPVGTIAATDVQAAIAEVASEATGGGSPTGSAGGVLDGTYPNPGLAAAVAGAGLAETADVLSVNVDGSTLEISTDTLRIKDGGVTAAKVAADVATQAELDAHTGDTTDAHAASAISIVDTGGFYTGTEVEAALQQIAGGGGAPTGTAGGDLNGTYPNPSVDAALFGGVGWTVITKAGDESVTSSTALQQDNDLLFTSVSGAIYEFEFVLVYANPVGGGSGDFKIAIWEDAAVRGHYWGSFLGTTDAVSFVSGRTVVNTDAGFGCGTSTANRAVRLMGSFTGGGGTFQLQWAQNASNGNPTILRAGSLLRYRRIV